MLISRHNRVKAWLENIADDVDKINNIFNSNLISKDDIGSFYHQEIQWKLYDLSTAIEEILFDLENKG